MIRTAILAGLLLVMLSIAYTHLGVQADLLPHSAALINEPPPVQPMMPSAEQKPVVKHVAAAAPVIAHPPRPIAAAPEAEDRPAPVAVKTEPAPMQKTVAAADIPVEQKEPAPARAAPVAEAASAPTPLVPPTRTVVRDEAVAENTAPAPSHNSTLLIAPAAAEAPVMTKAEDMPLIKVAPHPVMAPWDAPAGTTHNAVVTASAADTAIKQPDDAPKFMTPQERSRELYRLAREMEDLFVAKLAH